MFSARERERERKEGGRGCQYLGERYREKSESES